MIDIKTDYKDISGIYQILNTKNNKCYIGSSKNIYQRLMKHRYELNRQIHFNPYLQNAYNKDMSFFSVLILEKCEISILLKREQYYINTINPEYNICKYVEDFIIADESKIKISKTLKNKYKVGSIEPTNKTKIKYFDLNCNFKGVFDSIKEASITLNIRYHAIQKNLKKEFKQTHGFQFFYIHEEDPYIPIEINTSNISSKAIYNKLFIFDLKEKEGFKCTIQEACKFLNYKEVSLRAKLRSSKSVVKQRYIITPLARVKSSELLGTPEEDNQQPISANDVNVTEQVQRLTSEESTNNLDTSARQFIINILKRLYNCNSDAFDYNINMYSELKDICEEINIKIEDIV